MKFVLAALVASLALALPARAGDCDALTTAWVKHLHTAHRTTMVVTEPGKRTSIVQFVLLDGKFYIDPDAAPVWIAVDMQPDAAEAMYRKAMADADQTCNADGSETIGGEIFDIVAAHRKVAKGDIESSRIWISRKTGMLFEVEDTMPGGRRETSFYAFDDVMAPAHSEPPSPK